MDTFHASWQVLRDYMEQGRIGGVLRHDLPQVRGLGLTCLPRAEHRLAAGASTNQHTVGHRGGADGMVS